ncbi:MAG: transposase [Alteromonadaceae bacterium]|nr:transposase [Alteromonadaceae bacterium]
MPRPRKSLINLSDTSYYHCVSRCVRRAYLCGEDNQTGRSYEHRRQWVEDRLLYLAEVFCIDVCAYAVMSNHTHVVLRINKQKADSLSVKEIIRRWHRLYKGMLLSQRYIDPVQSTTLSEAEIQTVHSLAEIYRKRLYDISWFMRLLNEYIARRANKEDECTGHFWEGRFKSQALLDETSLAACMAYVDLNPVRACLANTPESSAHTSIQKRINAAKLNRQPAQLLPFTGNPCNTMPDGLPFQLQDYIELVELSGRYLHPNKKGRIDDSASPILTRVGLAHTDWNKMVTGIETTFKSSVSFEQFIRKRQKYTASS